MRALIKLILICSLLFPATVSIALADEQGEKHCHVDAETFHVNQINTNDGTVCRAALSDLEEHGGMSKLATQNDVIAQILGFYLGVTVASYIIISSTLE